MDANRLTTKLHVIPFTKLVPPNRDTKVSMEIVPLTMNYEISEKLSYLNQSSPRPELHIHCFQQTFLRDNVELV